MANDLDLRAIRAFVAVVETGDFTAAARTLRVTRSGVGKALAKLEASLGVKVLHRTTRRVSTTSDGAVFYDRCVRLLADLAEAQDAVRQERHDPRGALRLTLPDAYGRWRILPILQRYMRRWPEVSVEVKFSDRIDDIVEGGLDLAIRMGDGHASEGLVTRVVDRIDGVLCASPAYIHTRGMPGATEKLDSHDLLLFGDRGRIRPWPRPVPATATRSSQRQARTMLDSAEAQRLFALAGFGIAHLPHFLVASDVEAGRLVVLPNLTAETIDVYALYPGRRLLPARVRLFIDMLAEEIALQSR